MSLDKLKKAVESKKFKIGTELTIKALKKGEAKQVFVSKNCPEELDSKVKNYCEVTGAAYFKLNIDNEELGTVCKKPFSINICYSY